MNKAKRVLHKILFSLGWSQWFATAQCPFFSRMQALTGYADAFTFSCDTNIKGPNTPPTLTFIHLFSSLSHHFNHRLCRLFAMWLLFNICSFSLFVWNCGLHFILLEYFMKMERDLISLWLFDLRVVHTYCMFKFMSLIFSKKSESLFSPTMAIFLWSTVNVVWKMESHESQILLQTIYGRKLPIQSST